MIDHTKTSFETDFYLSPKQLREYVWETFEKHTSRQWVWDFVLHHSEQLEHAKAYLQEEARMNLAK
jgi:hypothetical protein